MLLEINNRNALQKYFTFAENKNIHGCTVTCKKTNEDLSIIVPEIKRITKNIIPTFSIKTEYNKTSELTIKKLLEFEKNLLKLGIEQALIVSGNPKRKLDTLDCLKELKKSDTKLNWGVAFNPFYLDMELEEARLKQKLKYPFVNQVYLQLGESIDSLTKGLQYIKSIQNNNVMVIGSILFPSVGLLNNLNTRPWNGVYYSNEFLSDIEYAKESVLYYEKILRQQDCKVLICGL
jgi:hypothetical protein